MPKITGFSYEGDIPKNPQKVINFAYSYTGYLLESRCQCFKLFT